MVSSEAFYFNLLQKLVFETHADVTEILLAEAFEFGRKQHELGVPPDAIIMLHHDAVANLAKLHPSLHLADVAAKINLSLIEMSMAYGLAFRLQIEQRYQDIVNNRLQHSAKLEAIGTLAAGIAHDFNNILGSIVGYAEMAGDETKANPMASHCIEQVLIASFRARDLVFRMLAFARQSPTIPSQINIIDEIAEAIVLLNSSLPPEVQIHLDSAVDKATIMADPAQIQQIIMNLCINAADAMPNGGLISIRIRPTTKSKLLEQETAIVKTPQDLCITVKDNGEGMNEEIQAKVFDPFFTTKAPNKGSGLGLSVVYGIVSSLGGRIELSSHTTGPDKGTEFKILLPAVTL